MSINSKRTSLSFIRSDYARLAASYERRWKRFNFLTRNWVLSQWPSDLPVSARVLDLGCGNGCMLRLLLKKHPDLRLKGVDASPDMLRIAKKMVPAANLCNDNIEYLDEDVAQYDVILSLNVLHHLSDHSNHIETLKQLLRPGGVIFLCDFAINTLPLRLAERWWQEFDLGHNRAYSQEVLEAWLKASGFFVKNKAYLKPGLFWRLQIYKLSLTDA